MENGLKYVECEIHNRAKDVGSATATWFAELLSPDPWFKNVVPNVRSLEQQVRDQTYAYYG